MTAVLPLIAGGIKFHGTAFEMLSMQEEGADLFILRERVHPQRSADNSQVMPK